MEEKEEGNQNNKINQDQVYDLITGDEVGWQEIIYDLIRTEQLDPWDINLGLLADRYLEKIRQLEEENFFISSKVLLACALLLRLKAELLINRDIHDLNEALYGRKEEKKYELQRIEIDESELPMLIPKTPLARAKKISLDELMSALNDAIETENRRIKKEIRQVQAEKSALVVLPKPDRINLKDRIKEIYIKVRKHINKTKIKMSFSELAPTRDEKLSAFLPILHLSSQEKLFLEQVMHFDEIYIHLDKLKEETPQNLTEEALKEFNEVWPEDKIIKEDDFIDLTKNNTEILEDKNSDYSKGH